MAALPRLGGRRPFLADAAAWFVAAMLGVTLAFWGELPFVNLAAGYQFLLLTILGPPWALWRFGTYSTRLMDGPLRRDLWLAGVPARQFLGRQLRRDAVAAFGPLFLPPLGIACYIAQIILARLEAGKWVVSSIESMRWGYLFVFMLHTPIFITMAGAMWIPTSHCRRFSPQMAAVWTTVTLLAAWFVPPALLFVHRLPTWPLALAALAALFCAAAQFGPGNDGGRGEAKPMRMVVAVSLGALLVAMTWPWFVQLVSGTLKSSGKPSAGMFSLAILIPTVLAMFIALLDMPTIVPRLCLRAGWAFLAIGALATTASTWLAAVFVTHSSEMAVYGLWSPQPVAYEFWIPLAMSLSASGVALLAGRMDSGWHTMVVTAQQALATVVGLAMGLAAASRVLATKSLSGPLSWESVLRLGSLLGYVAVGVAVAIAVRHAAQKCEDPPPRIAALIWGTAMILALDAPHWLGNTSANAFYHPDPACHAVVAAGLAMVAWRRFQRSYFAGI